MTLQCLLQTCSDELSTSDSVLSRSTSSSATAEIARDADDVKRPFKVT